jgi:hypothetical protein
MRGRISPRRSSLVSTLLAAVSSSTSSGESIVALEEITLTRDCWLLSDSYSNFHLELATLIGLDSCHGLAAVTEQNLYLSLPQTIPALGATSDDKCHSCHHQSIHSGMTSIILFTFVIQPPPCKHHVRHVFHDNLIRVHHR